MNLTLTRLPHYEGVQGPLLLIILDGMGLYRGRDRGYPGNAIELAAPPHLCRLLKNEKISTRLKAHGTAVGMPSDTDQGNSEVGHNAMGAGRVFAQGAKLVDDAIESGSLFEGKTWKRIIANSLAAKTPIHFIGLISDGNVHSNISQLISLIGQCDREGIEEVYVHGLLDGRDVPPISALRYFGELEDYLWSLCSRAKKMGKKRLYCVASGGGRMVTTMDRYEADWSIVERGYHAHVLGMGPKFPNCFTAIRSLRDKEGADDQYLSHWVIHKPGSADTPLAQIRDGHGVVLFNFRGDRALEISRAFVEDDFTGFKRIYRPEVIYAGILEYDADTRMPPEYLVAPPAIDRTLSEYLSKNGVSQYAISETQKFGHVTYFWNGNNSAKFNEKLEEWVNIESDRVPFDQAPEMKAEAIASETISALQSGRYKFLRLNFPNGDMVAHTGSMSAAVKAVNAVDRALGRLIEAVDRLGGTVVITADHGNCEQMIAVDEKTGRAIMGPGGEYKPQTSHTLNPVPFIVHGPDTDRYELSSILDPGLGNIAATILLLLGYEKPDDYLESIITLKD
ncbi:MAG TPA: 2,3-bisphosphoglycerate-independent phosphoglycerate mutase [Syntrophales bacterium]|nr:2,3-bisphosphoglycerate-independent phosphoglycerate mutase [Syntrophales bacterium]HPQ42784.1 2,3-bisphosphoglycerate-independent phosphoglycerate mutase [Syntrophales bacterium]